MSKDLIKTEKEIQIMREGGKILAGILADIKDFIRTGISTWDIEELFQERAHKFNVQTPCKGYTANNTLPPFPSGLCISINEQSVHCFPKKGRLLENGDLITIDAVIKYKDLHLDSAFSVGVGTISKEKEMLLETSEKALYEAASKVKDGIRIGKISHTLQKAVEKAGFNVLKDFAGHGIGYEMHEPPEILCYGHKNEGTKLKEGMTICIESLVCSEEDTVQHSNEWETKMKNGVFCIFEHTILVKKNDYEILTSL